MSRWIRNFDQVQEGAADVAGPSCFPPMLDGSEWNSNADLMDYGTTDADSFGRSLRGLGLNLLVRDVFAQVAFLEAVFEMTAFQPTSDFAIMTYGDQVFQLHSDGTYHAHPLLGLLPENPPRGAGIEIHLYDTDPDDAVARATALGATILAEPLDKPHGLREAYILCENGYAWVASRAK